MNLYFNKSNRCSSLRRTSVRLMSDPSMHPCDGKTKQGSFANPTLGVVKLLFMLTININSDQMMDNNEIRRSTKVTPSTTVRRGSDLNLDNGIGSENEKNL